MSLNFQKLGFPLTGNFATKLAQKSGRLLLLKTKRLLNFYLFGAKYWKGLNKFDKEEFLPTVPHRPHPPHPRRCPFALEASPAPSRSAAPTPPPTREKRDRDPPPRSRPLLRPRCSPRRSRPPPLRPRRSP